MIFRSPRHPGGIIRRTFMEPNNLTMTDLAKAMGVSVSSVSRLINEQAELTGDMALRLSYVLGDTPETWMNLQMQYNLSKALKNFNEEGLKRLHVPKGKGEQLAEV